MTPVLDIPARGASPARADRSRRARKIALRSAIPADVLAELEASGPVDWPRLAAITSAVFAVTGNDLAARAFWLTEADELDGFTPADVLVHPGGVDAVAEYARTWHRTRRRSADRVPQPA